MRYTDDKIIETLNKNHIINEDHHDSSFVYTQTISRKNVELHFINKQDTVWIEEHDNITVDYTIEVVYSKIGVEEILLTIIKIHEFNVVFAVQSEYGGHDEAGLREESIMEKEKREGMVTMSFDTLPVSIHEIDIELVIDYDSNELVNIRRI